MKIHWIEGRCDHRELTRIHLQMGPLAEGRLPPSWSMEMVQACMMFVLYGNIKLLQTVMQTPCQRVEMRLAIVWQGQAFTIERRCTPEDGADFVAREAGGKLYSLLRADTCGQMLTGLPEEGFSLFWISPHTLTNVPHHIDPIVHLLKEKKAQENELAYTLAFRHTAADQHEKHTILEKKIAKAKQALEEAQAHLPPAGAVRALTEGLYQYEGAVRLEKERREQLHEAEQAHQTLLHHLQNQARENSGQKFLQSLRSIRWIPLGFAFVFALASALTQWLPLEWGGYRHEMIWMFPALSLLALSVAFKGGVRIEPPAPPKEQTLAYTSEQLQLANAQMEVVADILQTACEEFIALAQAIDPAVQSVEEAKACLEKVHLHEQDCATKQEVLQNILLAKAQQEKADQEEENHLHALQQALQQSKTEVKTLQAQDIAKELDARIQSYWEHITGESWSTETVMPDIRSTNHLDNRGKLWYFCIRLAICECLAKGALFAPVHMEAGLLQSLNEDEQTRLMEFLQNPFAGQVVLWK